ncbi:hypothetical protein F5884DRAFT_687389, partial [Xylogone sp. PMI_703]
PYDIRVFSFLKIVYYDKVKKLFRKSIRIVSKEDFIYLYYSVRRKVFTKRNIMTI